MKSVVGSTLGLGLLEEGVTVERSVPRKSSDRHGGEGGSRGVGSLGRRGEKRSLAIGCGG